MRAITRTVWILSLVSLFTDISSEMLYPVIPIYLAGLNYSVLFIGILEGFAEATAGLSKGYFGKMSDNAGQRMPFVRIGYSLSVLSKPMMAVFTFPLWIFSARFLDRLGKGIRTGARDALLSAEATAATKGKVFGFHRGMDTLGAAIGPSFALIYLALFPNDLKTLFYIAFIPGVISIVFTFFIREKNIPAKNSATKTHFFDFVRYWKASPQVYRRLVAGLLFFALFNSSDMFLILRIKDSGFSDREAIGMYIFYNLVYAVFSYPLGKLGDRIGLKKVYIFGIAIFALVYIGMGLNNNIYFFFVLFFIYGLYTAATEGISKAWISNICDKKNTATAIGTFSAFQSICSLAASSLAGVIWFNSGAKPLFIFSGLIMIPLIAWFIVAVKKDH